VEAEEAEAKVLSAVLCVGRCDDYLDVLLKAQLGKLVLKLLPDPWRKLVYVVKKQQNVASIFILRVLQVIVDLQRCFPVCVDFVNELLEPLSRRVVGHVDVADLECKHVALEE